MPKISENPIISYLFIAVIIKYSLLEKGPCRKRKWPKSGSLCLLMTETFFWWSTLSFGDIWPTGPKVGVLERPLAEETFLRVSSCNASDRTSKADIHVYIRRLEQKSGQWHLQPVVTIMSLNYSRAIGYIVDVANRVRTFS